MNNTPSAKPIVAGGILSFTKSIGWMRFKKAGLYLLIQLTSRTYLSSL